MHQAREENPRSEKFFYVLRKNEFPAHRDGRKIDAARRIAVFFELFAMRGAMM